MFPIKVDTITSELQKLDDLVSKWFNLSWRNSLSKIRPSSDCPDKVLALFLGQINSSIDRLFLPVVIILPSWYNVPHDFQDISSGHGFVEGLTIPLCLVWVFRTGSLVQTQERVMDVRVNGWDIIRLVPVLQVCRDILLTDSISARFACHSSGGKHVEEELHSVLLIILYIIQNSENFII
jgi:hypothetical protein